MLHIPIKGILTKEYKIDSRNDLISISQRDDTRATGYLMRAFLQEGYSVIFYGKPRDYYSLVHKDTSSYLVSLGYKTIVKDYRFPLIDECPIETEQTVEKMFIEFEYESKYRYLNRKESVIALKNPSLYQCFYQIDPMGPVKENFICEAALVNLLSCAINTDGMLHKTVLFIDMPYKPVTNTALNTLNESRSIENIVIVPMYRGNADIKEKNECTFYSEERKIFIKSPRKRFEVSNG